MSVPVPLYLMRHGEPQLTGRLLGRTDSPAIAAGIAACIDQAAALVVTRIVSSDLSRAAACAEAIAAPRGMATTVDRRWRELDFGDWDGLAASDVDAAAIGRFWDDPDRNPPPGGERWSTLVARIGAAIDDLCEPTLVVTHGGAIRAALAVLCGFDQRQLWSFDLPYAAVVAVRIWRGDPSTAQITGLWA